MGCGILKRAFNAMRGAFLGFVFFGQIESGLKNKNGNFSNLKNGRNTVLTLKNKQSAKNAASTPKNGIKRQQLRKKQFYKANRQAF